MKPRTVVSILFLFFLGAAGFRTAEADPPTVAEDYRQRTQAVREELRHRGLPFLLHDFSGGPPRTGDSSESRVWSLVVENVSGSTRSIRAAIEPGADPDPKTTVGAAGTHGPLALGQCPALELRGPALLTAGSYAVFRREARRECAYHPGPIWIDSRQLDRREVHALLGPFFPRGSLRASHISARRLFPDVCPAGIARIVSAAAGRPTRRLAEACFEKHGVSFASAEQFCRSRRMRLPSRREAFRWLGSRRMGLNIQLRAHRGPNPLVWTSDDYQDGAEAVWVLDILRGRSIGHLRSGSAFALCVREGAVATMRSMSLY